MQNHSLSYEDPIPLSLKVPWTQAYPSYYWAWYIAILVNYLGALLNCLVIYVFLSSGKKIVESKEASTLIFSLSAVDILQGLWHGTVSLGSLIVGSFVGPSDVFCDVDVIVTGVLLLMSLGIMDLMSMHLYIRLTKPQKRKLALGYLYPALGGFSLGIALIVVLLPGGGILSSSGLLCISKYKEPTTYFFCGVITVMMGYVGVMYLRIFLYYQKITVNNKDEKISAKKRKLLMRFSLITVVSFGTFGPFVIMLVYGWITSFYPPGYFELFGILVMNMTVVSNPVIYFYSNPTAFKVLKFKLGIISEISSSSKGVDNTTDHKFNS